MLVMQWMVLVGAAAPPRCVALIRLFITHRACVALTAILRPQDAVDAPRTARRRGVTSRYAEYAASQRESESRRAARDARQPGQQTGDVAAARAERVLRRRQQPEPPQEHPGAGSAESDAPRDSAAAPDASGADADPMQVHRQRMLRVITGTQNWRRLPETLRKWQRHVDACFNPAHVLVCAFCAVCCLGSPYGSRGLRPPHVYGGGLTMCYVEATAAASPVELAYPWLKPFVVATNLSPRRAARAAAASAAAEDDAAAAEDDEDDPTDATAGAEESTSAAVMWNACSLCAEDRDGARAARQRHLVAFGSEHATRLLACVSLNVQRLSVLDVRPHVSNTWRGAGHGSLTGVSLTSGIIVTWDASKEALRGDVDAGRLTWLLSEMARRDNWILRSYASVLEYPPNVAGTRAPALAVLGRDVMSLIASRARARDPRADAAADEADEAPAEDDPRRRELWTLDDASAGRLASVRSYNPSAVFVTGTARRRTAPWAARIVWHASDCLACQARLACVVAWALVRRSRRRQERAAPCGALGRVGFRVATLLLTSCRRRATSSVPIQIWELAGTQPAAGSRPRCHTGPLSVRRPAWRMRRIKQPCATSFFNSDHASQRRRLPMGARRGLSSACARAAGLCPATLAGSTSSSTGGQSVFGGHSGFLLSVVGVINTQHKLQER